jgi:Methyltransferase domain
VQDREQWFTRLRTEWFREMRPLGAWVPWELQDYVQLEEIADEPFWGRGLIQSPPPLGIHHLGNCAVLPTRAVLFERLPHGGIVAEIGTLHGDFAREILRIANPRELHLVDQTIQSRARELAEDPSLKGRVDVHKSDSAETLQSFPDAYFDWIYIDAQHTYEGVKRDIVAAAAKVKSDGFLVFNDYTMWSYVEMQPYGVVAAVNEFCIQHDWEFAYLTLPDHMYCDVATRKMNRISSEPPQPQSSGGNC